MNNRDLHYLLLTSQHYCNKAIVKRTNAEKLMPGQPKILQFLLEHNGCTQKEIGQGCVLDKSTVTSLLYRMEDLGLITKDSHERDKRISRIFLTEEGKFRAERVRDICEEINCFAWTDISEEEKESFLRTFQKIINNLKRLEAKT